MLPQTYVAVDTEALAYNLRLVRTRMAEKVRLMAVVKANAYGHGLELAARTFAEAGADWLGVSTVAEGIKLRQAGLEPPILVFLPALPDELEALVEHRLTGTVVACDEVLAYARATEKLGRAADIHIYVDTGLGRLGSDNSLPDVLAAAGPYSQIKVTGVYTHFGPGQSGAMLEPIDILRPGTSAKAFGTLAKEAIAGAGAGRIACHCAASTLFLQAPEVHLDMVRIGTLLYGQKPPEVAADTMNLKPTFQLRSHIVAIHTLPPASPVGYGGEFVTRRETRIATVPVGLAHGLGIAPVSLARNLRFALGHYIHRWHSRRGSTQHGPWAQLHGQAVAIIGRISMDQCCLDVTDVEAQVGDEVALETRRVSTNPEIPRLAATIEQDSEKT